MSQIFSALSDLSPMFYLKIFGIIAIVIILIVMISKIFSILSDKQKDLSFEKKQEKLKQNKKNISELNKRFGISGRVSSAAFTETVDIEDIKETDNVELGHRRMSSKDFEN